MPDKIIPPDKITDRPTPSPSTLAEVIPADWREAFVLVHFRHKRTNATAMLSDIRAAVSRVPNVVVLEVPRMKEIEPAAAPTVEAKA